MHDLPTTALLGVRPSPSVLADCALANAAQCGEVLAIHHVTHARDSHVQSQSRETL